MFSIIKSSANLSPKDAFKMANSNSSGKMIDKAGQTVEIDQWLYATTSEIDEDGEVHAKDVLYIKDKNGEIRGSVSPTFTKAFMNIADTFGDDFSTILIVKGTSKNGREFVTCDLVE